MTGVGGFWSTLTETERQALRRVGCVHGYSAGQTILRRSGTDRWVAVLLAGRVRVIGTNSGRKTVIAVRQRGDILGELSLIDGRPRSAAVEAVTSVRALVLTPQQLTQVTEQHPRLLRVLLDVVAGRLREADQRRMAFTAELRTRLVSILVEMAERDGRPSPDGVAIPITSQTDLADLIGTSRESFGRALRELRDRGLVSTVRGVITVHDLAGLRRLTDPAGSGGDPTDDPVHARARS